MILTLVGTFFSKNPEISMMYSTIYHHIPSWYPWIFMCFFFLLGTSIWISLGYVNCWYKNIIGKHQLMYHYGYQTIYNMAGWKMEMFHKSFICHNRHYRIFGCRNQWPDMLVWSWGRLAFPYHSRCRRISWPIWYACGSIPRLPGVHIPSMTKTLIAG